MKVEAYAGWEGAIAGEVVKPVPGMDEGAAGAVGEVACGFGFVDCTSKCLVQMGGGISCFLLSL